ncbi:FGGY-family carbohydrate kinase [Pelagimonas varians]|uniref:L-fuculokinase n=1 Tax=Pelagimonas varians TaxID=696760 RepID=A0A238KQG5_9RHOB|nr:FGGY-family carbohydrate kinase [Pelagimonas varians]PYG28877.1 sugar (pentulose or hexulose) kinase [Pelagimonas varians]SMX44276.1 L-fuculokinase [Pelagimonas varians]
MSDPAKTPKHIAVIDVGKTNAKLALVDGETLSEIAVVTRPNAVIRKAPYPHFDLDGHWAFFLENLAAFHSSHGVDAISITTHGAALVLVDDRGNLATPMLDYEHDGPDGCSEEYGALRPEFSLTGSPRLPGGLNAGAQLHWLFEQDPSLLDRTAHVITYPQYWAYRLTGELACDVTSLGCHTDLWNPWTGSPSGLVETLGLSDKLAPALPSSQVLGTLTPDVVQETGLRSRTPVVCGIHDSNASLVPYLQSKERRFSVVSTGTWVVVMAVNGAKVDLDPARDTLVNVNALGAPVPSARFMGGREYELIRNGSTAEPTAQDRQAVLQNGIMLLPAVEPNSGPFPGRVSGWSSAPETDGQRIYALSLYLALMTDSCLGLIGAQGPTLVEGSFARNLDFLDMLAVLRPEGAGAARSKTGTSIGAAMLVSASMVAPVEMHSKPETVRQLERYAENWRACL